MRGWHWCILFPGLTHGLSRHRYLVSFREHDMSRQEEQALIQAANVSRVFYSLDQLGDLAAVQLEDERAIAFLRDHGATVEPDQEMHAYSEIWNLDRIDAAGIDNTFNTDNLGELADIFILDTGVRLDHVEFSGRLQEGEDLVYDGSVGFSVGPLDFDDANDCDGHGTHVAGTAAGTQYGVAKGAKVHPVRVLNCLGSGFNSDIIAGMEYVRTHPASIKIVGMSLGGSKSTEVNLKVAQLHNAGITVVRAYPSLSARGFGLTPCGTSRSGCSRR